jgi:hypothetical protein
MKRETGTIEKLQSLIRLYDEGYRSDTVDRAVTKLVRLEIEQTEKDLQRLKARLQHYEEAYDLNSEVFYQRFRAGDMGDDATFVEWSIFWDMYQATTRRLHELAEQPYDPERLHS